MWVYFSVCSVWTTFMLTTKWIIVETSLADYIQCPIFNNQRSFSWICLYSQKPKIVTKTWKPIIYVDLKIISRQWMGAFSFCEVSGLTLSFTFRDLSHTKCQLLYEDRSFAEKVPPTVWRHIRLTVWGGGGQPTVKEWISHKRWKRIIFASLASLYIDR